VEAGLEKPGKEGLLALLKLKGDAHSPKSTLEPPEGLAPLTDAQLPQKGVAMQTRRQLIDVGDRLRGINLFSGLSAAEATVLGTFMERESVEAGTVVIREGDTGDDLFLIEGGEADVQVGSQTGAPVTVARLGPGDFFGEIALLTGEERMADVIAVTPLSLLRLTKDAFTRYLTHATEVEQQLSRTAASRARETARRMTRGG
jgi:CRP-like cAMP-binding protein